DIDIGKSDDRRTEATNGLNRPDTITGFDRYPNPGASFQSSDHHGTKAERVVLLGW
ncbi:hypothetical protein A2U01_0100723, partial [Trifolium medium]|nr:hypothetical protein [Trifolium medium]